VPLCEVLPDVREGLPARLAEVSVYQTLTQEGSVEIHRPRGVVALGDGSQLRPLAAVALDLLDSFSGHLLRLLLVDVPGPLLHEVGQEKNPLRTRERALLLPVRLGLHPLRELVDLRFEDLDELLLLGTWKSTDDEPDVLGHNGIFPTHNGFRQEVSEICHKLMYTNALTEILG